MTEKQALCSELTGQRGAMWLLGGYSVANTFSKIGLSYAMGWFINLAIAGQMTRVLGVGALALAALGLIYVFSVSVTATRLAIMQRVQQRLKAKIYRNVFQHDCRQAGVSTSDAFNVVETVVPTLATDYFGSRLSRIGNILQVTLCSLALLWVSVPLFGLFGLISAIPFLVNPLIRRRFGRYKGVLNREIAAHMTLWTGILNGLTTIKAFSATPIFTRQLTQADGQLEEQRRNATLWDVRISQLSTLLTMGAQIGCMLVAALFILNRQITVGDLTITMQLLNYIVPASNGLNVANLKMSATQPLQQRMQPYLAVTSPAASRHFRVGKIVVKNLSYRYGSESPVFTKRNMTFDYQQKTAIIGPSGCGKSTLMKIIAGQLTGYQGTVTIGGVAVKDIEQTELYRHVVYIDQAPMIFRGTVLDNVTLFGAIQSPVVDEILRRLGLFAIRQRVITAGNAQLSGGERQRISLARALLVAAPVLIIDEPDSGQDPVTSAIIQRLIFGLRGRTVLVVTHNWDEAYLARFEQVVRL
ncbi:ATP-binding cassette domain-containing protein [Levilactobacillus enshiensis]|uniref:ATP-binding cassette domain-containing protein n=1 Tax=Levilactobacillus enshiensis TaxID=2590213 RepID=UPI00117B056B|nr:ABC transporter ATP-binding protein [Levilactobacillus enshiensis]